MPKNKLNIKTPSTFVKTPKIPIPKKILINFSQLDKNQWETLGAWEEKRILSKAIETLNHFCDKTVPEAQKDGNGKKFTIYGDFPSREVTSFTQPSHVTADAKWTRIHVDSTHLLIWHLVDNIFYLVFLDWNHSFWKSDKKYT